jgi:2-polyprenyl-3-methyl-5-hydroxy-6-metoxy-1,4-benzoquinol methylase
MPSKLTKSTKFGYRELSDKPSESELSEYYEKKYYQEGTRSYEVEYSSDELEYIQNKIDQKFFILNDFIDSKIQKRLLDVGCGEGFVLKNSMEAGFSVKGIDFSEYGVQKHNPSVCKYFVKGNIFKLLDMEIKNSCKYDVVWLENVLEHVLDPVSLMNSIHKIIDENGILVITVPNDFSFIQDHLIKNNLIDEEYWIASPDHISYFNTSNIEEFLNLNGWSIKELTGDFPIEWYLMNESSNYNKNKDVGKNAHLSRINIENLIARQDPILVRNVWTSLAKIGATRNITMFLSRNNKSPD